MMNNPNRKILYARRLAAGIKRNAPMLNTTRPVMMPFLYPNLFRMNPAGIAEIKYAKYTAVSTKVDCIFVSCNAFLRCGISIPFKLLAMPQRKNKLDTSMKGSL